MNINEIRQKYPQYNDMSDEQLAQSLHRKYYSDMPYGQFAEKVGLAAAVPEQPIKQRSFTDELGRQAGLALRYGLEGVAGIPGIFINPFQQAAGGKTMSQATSDLLTRAGVPQPETPAEEVSGAISRGVSGGGTGAGLARAIPSMLNASPGMINNILAAKPGAQIMQAGIGGGASEVERQSGGGPVAQMVAGAVTPMAVTGAANVVSAVGRGGRELLRPITQGGAEQVAADVLGEIASSKQNALRNLEQYQSAKASGANVGVPGSLPTAGAVSADYGLIGGEQLAARGPSNPEFAKRLAENNQARLNELAKLRATQEQLDAYRLRRDAITAPLREQAFANAKIPVFGVELQRTVDVMPVARKIGELVATPEGGRIESTKALRWLTDRLEKYTNEGRIDPENMYALQKDVADLVAGKIAHEGSALRLAGGLANEVKKTLSAQIDDAAPGFKDYLQAYSRLSKPIDRLEVITERLGGADLAKVTNALPMAGPGGPAFQLSQAKMRNQLGNIENQIPVGPKGLPLAPYQRNVLGRVMGDLNSQELALRGGKPPGSDTYQNMATANLLSAIFGKNLAGAGVPKAVAGPFNFAYKPLEQRIRNLVDEAYLNPEKMAELLKRSRTRRNSPTLLDVINSAETNVYGGLLGSNVGK